ncbi:MAG: N-acetylglutaminylglutamine synthetase [Alphaproteobacteria bacterium]|nr:N-acetylglutaminylglutamine synthetase [Alphaproteobacteria bacterium]
MTAAKSRPADDAAPAPASASAAGPQVRDEEERPDAEAVVALGWGRVLFGETFEDPARLADALQAELEGERDIAIYVADPHLVLAAAPQALFLDPSHTYRLPLGGGSHTASSPDAQSFTVRALRTKREAQEMNRLYAAAGMALAPIERLLAARDGERVLHLLAIDAETGAVLGTVTGLDHYPCFNDPARGASLWSLAVDPHAPFHGVGEALIRALADRFTERGAAHLDLSVMADNEPAIALYEKLGFERLPLFSVKCRNHFNEPLYTAPEPAREPLRQDAEVIVREARRRGVAVEIEDADSGLVQLSLGGRTISCDESLTDLTSAVAFRRCDERRLTLDLFRRAGLPVPDHLEAGDPDEEAAFLKRAGAVVVKPMRRSAVAPVTVDVRDPDILHEAVAAAVDAGGRVLLEEHVPGDHLRILVIENRVVAGALRRPAEIVGDGRMTARQLVELQSRRKAAASGGESRIPWDAETRACLFEAGYALDGRPAAGEVVRVRRTPSLTEGGSIQDVTALLHHRLCDAAATAARTVGAPVVGIDVMVDNPTEPEFVLIGADPQPSLAHHQPQPAAERFLDMLFPQTARRRV